jgi:DmsE family decaheme c-type cytochrome
VFEYHKDCLTCHTPTDEKHFVEGGKTMQFPDAEKCLACHQKQDMKRKNWAFSEHGKAKLNCRDCHGIHQPKQPKQLNLALWKTDNKSAVCMGCHQDVAARMNMSSHHPVKEGALSCVSCHDPHGGKQTTMMTKNEKCFECHQAIRGPKVFEHAPVVEDCTICHNPHGAPNRRLLQIAQPMLCLQCHSLAGMHRTGGTPGLNGAQLRNCTNCHGAIHGSHIDAKLKY